MLSKNEVQEKLLQAVNEQKQGILAVGPQRTVVDLECGSVQIIMGVHPKVVQELLGHSTITMTMDGL